MELAELSIAGVGAVPLVLALTELVKRSGIAVQYAPVISVVVGVLVVALAQGFSITSVMAGVVVGLSASGLWSGAKNLGRLR